jgi:uncharacterized protein YecT (DUF1311 family)
VYITLDLMMKLLSFKVVLGSVLTVCAISAAGVESVPDVMDWDGMPMATGCDQNTITINQCAFDIWKKADDELNALYQDQLRYLRSTEAEYPPTRGASRRLISAQRAWVEFRDKDCAYRIGEPGGSGDEFERLKCSFKLTRTRISEIREYVKCRFNGCPY